MCFLSNGLSLLNRQINKSFLDHPPGSGLTIQNNMQDVYPFGVPAHIDKGRLARDAPFCHDDPGYIVKRIFTLHGGGVTGNPDGHLCFNGIGIDPDLCIIESLLEEDRVGRVLRIGSTPGFSCSFRVITFGSADSPRLTDVEKREDPHRQRKTNSVIFLFMNIFFCSVNYSLQREYKICNTSSF